MNLTRGKFSVFLFVSTRAELESQMPEVVSALAGKAVIRVFFRLRPAAWRLWPRRSHFTSIPVNVMQPGKPKSVDEYIASAKPEAIPHLNGIRAILRRVAPDAREELKWGYPVFEEKRILFSYSAHKAHLNFMPTGPSIEPFKHLLTGFRSGKDTIQFPYAEPLPMGLIEKIAAHRADQVRHHDARWMY